MAVELNEWNDGRIVHAQVTDRLTKEDYKRFTPEVERLIQKHGKIRVLVEMRDFRGWNAGALWKDIKFDAKHFSDIDRLALVGEKKWQKGMSVFCKPFTTATIRYFDLTQVEEAHEWIKADVEASV